MSSFKRKTSTKQGENPSGTKLLPGSSSVLIASTGIPSLDDILGGGLPLTCLQVILAPDAHTGYGELVQKYFLSQGLASGQDICVIHDHPRNFVEGSMWLPVSSAHAADDDQEEKTEGDDAKIKIAWRYEQMKKFQTTVTSSDQSGDNFHKVFDLTSKMPALVIDNAVAKKQLTFLDIPSLEERPIRRVLEQINELLGPEETEPSVRKPLRICVPSFGAPVWGDVEPKDLCYFLYTLRSMLQRHRHACASVSLPSYLSEESWGGPGWINKLGWFSDACISLSAFSANPSLSAIFPSYHGFVHIHSLPAPLALVPPSDKYSSLRGLSSSGENNLAFKCMRKRLVFETLHLDLEGGVSERRTT
ncbi:hypothetical protein PHLGIDRAFT_56188, partial [Phlebiopsis gigantea 11061_1 CR5-6]